MLRPCFPSISKRCLDWISIGQVGGFSFFFFLSNFQRPTWPMRKWQRRFHRSPLDGFHKMKGFKWIAADCLWVTETNSLETVTAVNRLVKAKIVKVSPNQRPSGDAFQNATGSIDPGRLPTHRRVSKANSRGRKSRLTMADALTTDDHQPLCKVFICWPTEAPERCRNGGSMNFRSTSVNSLALSVCPFLSALPCPRHSARHYLSNEFINGLGKCRNVPSGQ